MISWRGEGLLLAARTHGETSAIIDVFTPDQGRYAGVVRGGASRKMTPVLQPGATLAVEWSARLEEHLGTFRVEPQTSRAALMGHRATLATLSAVCGLLRETLPERSPVPGLYERTIALLESMPMGDWMSNYVLWELDLLSDLGFGLDLSKCAATGAREDLVYLSPKSGVAVSRAGAGAWADKLLPLPAFLRTRQSGQAQDIVDGLRTTGFFLRERLAKSLHKERLSEPRDAAERAIRKLLEG
ncbi:MAG: DNA repair protein RecO [Pseudomonadota bacterium]